MEPWYVEEDGLEEESEADPLVVLVVFLIPLPVLLVTISPSDAGSLDPRVGLGLLLLGVGTDQTAAQHNGYILTTNLGLRPEGGVDPAVGVHRIPGNLLHDAVNGVPDVLPAGHQQARSHQDHEGGLDAGFRSNYLDR